jgi:uncharacterized protein YcbK (DUF882 family)
MRSLVLGAAITLAFAGAGLAQTTNKKSTASKPATVQKTNAPATKGVVHPQSLRGTRYGLRPPVQSLPPEPDPPPPLDLTSPRSLALVNSNSGETLTVIYWSDGAYRRDALDKLNHFLRDSRENAQTEMDPLLYDVLWHTMQIIGYGGEIEVLSAYRSPTSNAWLASVSRGVAQDSQHMNGNAMDVRFSGLPVFKVRQAARSLNMGGVGFYPRSGFVHLDTGPVRYW